LKPCQIFDLAMFDLAMLEFWQSYSLCVEFVVACGVRGWFFAG